MTYDIRIDARTACNTRLSSVMLRHEPLDADKTVRLRESMLTNGWEGRPVVLLDCGDHHMAFNGVHRLCAAHGIDDLIEAVFLPDDLTPEQWDCIDCACDDDDLLRAFRQIAEERDDMDDVVAAMQAEVDANNA